VIVITIMIIIKRDRKYQEIRSTASRRYVPDVQEHVQHKSPQLLSFVGPVDEHAVHRHWSGDRSPHVAGRNGRRTQS